MLPTTACLVVVSKSLVADTEEVVEVVLLRSVEFAFSQIVGIHQTLLQQTGGFRVFLLANELLGQFHPCQLILCRYLAFAALPGMERVAIDERHGLAVASQEI